MMARAYKHVLQAVIAASNVKADLAVNIATTLSMMLGTPEKQDPNMQSSLFANMPSSEAFATRFNIHTRMCHLGLEVHYLLGKPMLEGYYFDI